MEKYPLNDTLAPLNINEWRMLNENWVRIKSYFNSLQHQIKVLAGGEEVDELLARIENTISEAEVKVNNAVQGMESDVQTLLNRVATELDALTMVVDNSNNATDVALNAATSANNAAASIQSALDDLNTALTNFEHRGEWSEDEPYFKHNTVTFEGASYRALKDCLGDSLSDASAWALVAEKGDKGETGVKGDKGDQGDVGPQGPQGIQGPKGDKGDKGETGTGINLLGSLNGVSELPVTGSPGDAYLINGSLYVWSENVSGWEDVGSIQGPKGDQGLKGDTGEQGPIGPQGLKGETGPQGPAGPQGEKGDKGDPGEKGEQGETGPQGPAGSDANVTTVSITSALGYTPANDTDMTELERQVSEHLDDYTQFKNNVADNDYRLSKQSNTLQREVAYLKLMQEASERINGGNLFATDFSGNEFGISLNQAASTNIIQKDGSLIMATSTEEINNVEANTIINQVYKVAGNGGRKLVKIENGWLVTVLKATHWFYFYVSKDNGITWEPLCRMGGTDISEWPGTLVSKGNFVYLIHLSTLATNEHRVMYAEIDVTAQSNSDITAVRKIIDNNQTALQASITAVINEEGTEIHAAWASKGGSLTTSFNIRYAKGIINLDGTIVWGNVEQVTALSSSANCDTPSITLVGNTPIIAYSIKGTGATLGIKYAKKGVSAWNIGDVYSTGGSAYSQSNPSIIYVPGNVNGLQNGRIWVAWHGSDNVHTNENIRVNYSDDGGNTWSNAVKLTNEQQPRYMNPSITANKNNEIYIVFQRYNYDGINQIKWSNGSWGNLEGILADNGTTPNNSDPSTLYDVKMNFSKPLIVYTNNRNSRVEFNGTWIDGTETPKLTATAILDIDKNTDFVGVFIEKKGDLNVQAYFNNQIMDSELDGNEYQFTKQLNNVEPATLRLELSRPTIDGGNNDSVTRILGGIA